MKKYIFISLTFIVLTFISCNKNEEDQCKDQVNKVWNPETKQCENKGPASKAQSSCEDQENKVWNPETKQCENKGPTSEAQTSCEDQVNKVWNPETKQCENKEPIPEAQASCKEQENKMWNLQTKQCEEITYTVTHKVNKPNELLSITSDGSSRNLTYDQCVQVTATQLATLRITSSSTGRVCNHDCSDTNDSNIEIVGRMISYLQHVERRNPNCPDKL